jgi:hypothetical protein
MATAMAVADTVRMTAATMPVADNMTMAAATDVTEMTTTTDENTNVNTTVTAMTGLGVISRDNHYAEGHGSCSSNGKKCFLDHDFFL